MGAGNVQQTARSWRGRHGGFTLIELMIVVAVVAILAAIAVPAYNDQVRKGRRGQAQVDLVELTQLAERFHTVNNTYVGFPATLDSSLLRSPHQGTMYYQLRFEDVTQNEYSLTATPQGTQTKDAVCMTMSINSIGVKTITGGTGPVTDCWR